MSFVYLFQMRRLYKIGVTRDVEQRRRCIDMLMPYPVRIVHAIVAPSRDRAFFIEKILQKRFASRRLRGEWFVLKDSDRDQIIRMTELDFPPDLRERGRVAIAACRFNDDLKRILGAKADAEGLPLNEYMARVLAGHVGQPELGRIPRKSYGRPRKDAQATPEPVGAQ